MARYLSKDEEQEGLDWQERRKKLLEEADKSEEGLEEQGLEDYIMPAKRALQSGAKAAVLSAVRQKAKVKVKPPKDTDTTISYDKPFGGKPTITHSKSLPGAKPAAKEKEDEWLKKLLED